MQFTILRINIKELEVFGCGGGEEAFTKCDDTRLETIFYSA